MKIALHLGMGDIICSASIVCFYAKSRDVVEIGVWKHNYDSAKSIFINYNNISIKQFTDGKLYENWIQDAEIKLGYYNGSKQLDGEDFVQWFYRQSGLDIKFKSVYCPIAEAKNKVPQIVLDKKYFLHDDGIRGFNINSVDYKLVYRPQKTISILSHCDAIESAEEVHCIDSSFYHLVECLDPKGKLFYHKNVRPNSPTYYNSCLDWVVIDK